jgi:hypothetical protein
MITVNQQKDLRLLKPSEPFEVGGIFYRKDPDGFHTCCISEGDLVDETRAHLLRLYTEQYFKEERLFIRINKPWQSFDS